jgi:phosphatidylserine decarboxylase
MPSNQDLAAGVDTAMTVRAQLLKVLQQEDINFLLTNRIPRRLATRFIGWFSRIEQPLVRDVSIALWRLLSDLDLGEAKKTEFRSMHDCFVRQLKDGMRPIDHRAEILVSPCDAIVGACGTIAGTDLYQAKGFQYGLDELLCDPGLVEAHRNGCYVTLRLTSSMYHRFHAPHDCRIDRVIYVSGDTWNVNPIALKRIERLFCKNERAVLRTTLTANAAPVTLVAVAAILVASIRLNFLDIVLNLAHRGPNVIWCDARYRKGEELGRFEHGSTIIVFAPKSFALCERVRDGAMIRMGEPLMRFA